MKTQEITGKTFQARDQTLKAAAFVIFLMVTVLFWSNSLQGDWHFDDFSNIVNNPDVHVTTLSYDELRTVAEFRGITNRPAAYISFGINHYFNGLNPWGYLLVNLVIHFAAAWFLFLFIAGTLRLPVLNKQYGEKAFIIALLATLVWMLHPLQVSTVAYIVQRMAGMAALFYIIAMYCYMKARTAESPARIAAMLALCIASGLLSLASKENAAILPITLFVYEVVLIRGIEPKQLKKLAPYGLPVLALVLIAALWTIDFGRFFQGYDIRPYSLSERLMTQARVFVHYLSLLFYPVASRMMFFHDIPVSAGLLSPPSTAAAIGFILAAFSGAMATVRRYPLLSFCFLFFFLNHLIEGTIIPLELIFEHRNYLPSMLLFIPPVIGVIKAWEYFAFSRLVRATIAAGVFLFILLLGETTADRSVVYESRLSLLVDNVLKAPHLSRVHNNLGTYYWEQGYHEKAFDSFARAIELERDVNLPRIAEAHFNMGLYYTAAAGDDAKAQVHFDKALHFNPAHTRAKRYLDLLEFKTIPPEKQQDAFAKLLSDIPSDGGYMYRFSVILLESGRALDAIQMAQMADRYRPGFIQPHKIEALAWVMHGNPDEARRTWQRVLERAPGDMDALRALLVLFYRAGNEKGCREIVQRLKRMSGEKDMVDFLESGRPSPDFEEFLPDDTRILKILDEKSALSNSG